jgi:hypothetical protein
MAKEQGFEQDPQKSPPDHSVSDLLRKLIRSPGLTIKVQGREKSLYLKGGVVDGIKVDSAWIRFAVDGCMLRTVTIKDRTTFLTWLTTDGQGKLDAEFYKEYGTFPKPAEDVSGEKPQIPMRSRARESIRRNAWDDMRHQVLNAC